jgi:hypothetical protein
MQIKSTREARASGVKLLVYGQSGAGKTSLIPTLPRPLIISAEGGLLSIADADLPYVEVSSIETLREVYTWLTKSEEGAQFESVALDSISEIAEVVLSAEKAATKDPRKAYGEMQDVMASLIRSFRDLPGKHVYFSAKLEKSQDEMGRILYAPSMPGQKLGQLLPYYFDEVLALRVEKDAQGDPMRTLQAQPDGLWAAKDRSGKLDAFNAPDLGAVIETITGGNQ